MGLGNRVGQHARCGILLFVTAALVIFPGSFCLRAQTAGTETTEQWSKELDKYPGLLPEFGRLIEKLQRAPFPAERYQSRLLPLLPEATVFYAAIPNYGEVSHQALIIFRQELQESPVLRNWYEHSDVATSGPKMELFLEKFYQLSQYLGDEIVLSGAAKGSEPSLLLIAEVRKPGLRDFLRQTVQELAGTAKPTMRILDVQELASAQDSVPQQPVVLVRPDFVLAAADLPTLRTFNARLNQSSKNFASIPFGTRIAQAYGGGASIVTAIDLQSILKQVPASNEQSHRVFQRTGFSDMKYAVWKHGSKSGRSLSDGELSFTGPRHGIAAWLATPSTLGSLDFVAPNPLVAATVVLTNPAKIYDDIKELSTVTNPNAFAMVQQWEQMLNVSLRNDLLGRLGGEITIELDNLAPQQPDWKVILRANDSRGLQQTLSRLLGAANLRPEQVDEKGIAYYTVHLPSPKRPMAIGYAFVDGYLIVGSTRETVSEAVRRHSTGESLEKSKSFVASLPPGHPSGLSAMLYEDPTAMLAMQMRQLPPQIANSLASGLQSKTPFVVCAYGEESAIREATTSTSLDPTMVLIGAAVAVPNLLRARIAANEASAAGTLRMLDTAQVTYSVTYPHLGYAPDLGSLGPDPKGSSLISPTHANLIDSLLGNPSCTPAAWCVKSGFQFSMRSICQQKVCKDYVVVGTPVSSNTGARSFCSTSDGIIRFRTGLPVNAMLSPSECNSWVPVQ